MRARSKPRGRRSSGRKTQSHNIILAIIIIFMMMAGLAMVLHPTITVTSTPTPGVEPQQGIPGIKSAEEIVIERQWGPLAPVVKAFSDLGKILAGKPAGDVGIEAEIGYTSTTGESVVFTQKFSGVGFLGMSGIYVKPKLGDYRALKLYDANRDIEGEVWIKPAIRIKAYNGEPEEYSFTTKIKVVADGELVEEKTLSKAGKGLPPEKIDFEKVSVRGMAFHLLALGEKQLAKSLLRGEVQQIPRGVLSRRPQEAQREICYYADYQGLIKFKEDEEPIVKELKDIKLGCFTFQFRQTGDFEMEVEKDITVAPLAEVMVASESGMEGLIPIVETKTITITMPDTTQVVTKVETKWATVTKTVTVQTPGPERVVTVTKTVTEYVDRRYLPGYYAYAAVTIYYPYSAFIFIRGG